MVILKWEVWRNNKTGANYQVVDFAINTTNDSDGQLMVVYRRKDEFDDNTYVRESKEFSEKFTRVKDIHGREV